MLFSSGADIVVESFGTSQGPLLAYKLLRNRPQSYGADDKVEPIALYRGDGPRLIIQANYFEPISINPFTFGRGEGMTMLVPMDCGIQDRQKSVEGIRLGQIKATDFVDKVAPYDQAPAAYEVLRGDKKNIFSFVFDWTKA
ncbi:hypothetical protein BH09VER1_BH09VER1_36320 [soil metagenome]